MKKIDLGQTISILANIGVLVGIVFVGYELRQSNRIAVGTTSYELSRNWMAFNDLIISDPELRNLLVELRNEDFEADSDQHSELANAYARRLVANWMAIQEAYDNGLASQELYDTAMAEVSRIITFRPGAIGEFEEMPSAWLNYELMQPMRSALEERRSP